MGCGSTARTTSRTTSARRSHTSCAPSFRGACSPPSSLPKILEQSTSLALTRLGRTPATSTSSSSTVDTTAGIGRSGTFPPCVAPWRSTLALARRGKPSNTCSGPTIRWAASTAAQTMTTICSSEASTGMPCLSMAAGARTRTAGLPRGCGGVPTWRARASRCSSWAQSFRRTGGGTRKGCGVCSGETPRTTSGGRWWRW
mmetsp:Transcript_10191/g.33400  ORF Transcript_10191/g.33400 Transcript_10191/m.33400 type:complete len:200 (+) Transcript_10191:231-830(+)